MCPECGKEQPEHAVNRARRAAIAWIAICAIYTVLFASMAWLAVVWGTPLGARAISDAERFLLMTPFAVMACLYGLLGFELWWNRTRLPAVDVGAAWIFGIALGLSGLLVGAFVLLAIVV